MSYLAELYFISLKLKHAKYQIDFFPFFLFYMTLTVCTIKLNHPV